MFKMTKAFVALSLIHSVSFAQKQWTKEELVYSPCHSVAECRSQVNKMQQYINDCKKKEYGDFACDDNHVKLARQSQAQYKDSLREEQLAPRLGQQGLQDVLNHSEKVPTTKKKNRANTNQ